jgi:hypothetical protein
MNREEWRKRKLEMMKGPSRLHVNIDDYLNACEERAAEREHLKLNGIGNGDGSEPKRYCDCRECVVGGRRTPVRRFHDCAYVKARSELVRIAVARTSAVIDNSVASRDAWTKRFNCEMDRLSAPLLR